ncbi:hypothetical protein A3F29_02320 [Candidatus Roizmanbacteria bacterium RIFCSPHIGHO2_12_FULL_33_9]|uniref:Cytidyltransferase-like domain-containing protein n=1 Tax=Candidatus Roizmanbacteria bacterium RIFCSPHIGHO2_12_FULL_33_9 TaxID=1802045 RepID=A0A1F7HJG1_9BACT|nr:MAG: hypothetical protein A3F29_02320 [Candidatus Roizmanbacteria bacterium RIFCSPHIGHO2_12_FULL_33_9]
MKALEYSDKKKIKKLISGKKVVLVGGCFDIVHLGHIKFLEGAKKQGDFLVVALESDEFIKKRKNKNPFHNIDERAEILSSIIYVDLVIKLPMFKNNHQYLELTKLIMPKVIGVSQNDPYLKEKQIQAKEVGGKVKVVSEIIKKFSSTQAIRYETILSN